MKYQKGLPVWGWCLIGVGLAFGNLLFKAPSGQIVPVSAATTRTAPTATVKEAPVKGFFEVGEACRLKGPNGEGSFVALSAEGFNGMLESFTARDEHGRLQLMLQNQVLFLSEPTNGIYLKSDWDAFVVRLTEGPHAGERVWVMKAFVNHR